MDPVSSIIKRAYRDQDPPQLPPKMEELLRKLREAETAK